MKNNLVIDYYSLGRPHRPSGLGKPAVAIGLVACLGALVFLASIHSMPEERYRPLVQKYGSRVGMETELVLAVIGIESRARPYAVSPKGAMGLMQLLPSTAEDMAEKEGISLASKSDLFDPEINIRLGTLYLSTLLTRYHGDVVLALGAYNAGPGRIREWRKKNPNLTSSELCDRAFFEETRKYVAAVVKRRTTLLRIRGGNR